ncbi:ABC transporter ATP-binding protein [Caldinitratiruptor microaerophilus]|uniref:ABC transporter ATP-binding protein n=1 Tax=Caldinitratiruptor microaerophilus TaxID=671077 RepID=A0AA35CPB6_9FIRM|nr:ABC transporter ATP-binding protein [Caldinitratiruptor microaerophilus]BDG62379.1 ABC transporter ATP-binding protein [Caldinitratiruptor microaerophilus]
MLEVHDLHAGYRGTLVLQGVSLEVRQGEVVALLGSNGTGKSTLVRAVSGVIRPARGTITFRGERIDGLPAHRIVGKGIAHVPEGRLVFPRLTVEQNLLLGAYTKKDPQRRRVALERVFALFPRLQERRRQLAGTLSGGEQQMLAIARGLMSEPQLLMLDEPSLGVMPKLVTEILEMVRRIAREGTTVLLVEQNVREALEIADRAYVLQTGRIVLEGTGAELLDSELVRKAYLGL